MRRSRWPILAAFIFALVFVGAAFLRRKEFNAGAAPAPAKLESGIAGRANDWVYTQSDGVRPRVTIRAKNFKQIQAPSLMQLEGVELELYQKDGKHFDLVKCATAQFDIAAKSLFSPDDVDITMGEPMEGQPAGRILKIHSSGVRFASDTGKATTDRPAAMEFDLGTGRATGVDYDPVSRELHLRSHVVLDWHGKPVTADEPKPVPMHAEAGEAFYHEGDSKVFLQPWSKLTRGNLHMEAAASQIALVGGAIQEAIAQAAHGVQEDPNRKVEFAGDQMVLTFADDMQIQQVKGERNAKVISTANFLRTTITADAVHLDFARENAKESIFSSAVATGKSVAEAKPLERPGELLADTRILRSETIHLKMRPGGRDIEDVVTDGVGTVEFLPNRAGQPRRELKGDRVWIAYAPDNRIQSFHSINATTRTDKPNSKVPMITSSKDILALFDPKTSELTRLEQKTDFHYEEGTRKATSDKATLEEAKNSITLDGAARSWDPTGSASADRIVMNQMTGDVVAEGHVATVHVPEAVKASEDKKPPAATSSAMLSNTEVMQGRAQRITSRDRNQKLHYEGAATVWQGANRIDGERIDIDRSAQTLEAHGKVVSQFADKARDDKSKDDKAKSVKPAPPVFTVVRAPDLTYKGETRVADYTGGVLMTRPELTINSKELRAFLSDSESDTSLDRAVADGNVKILSTAQKRTRTGTSEHSEYYVPDQKVLMSKGDPLLVDSVKGQTRGSELTWWINNDRLLVNGVENRPVDSLLRKK